MFKNFGFIIAVASLVFATSLQALEVTDGLTHHQVIQCDDDGMADVALSGTASETGTLEAQVVGV